MASASTTAIEKSFRYDLFLSFMVEDLNFVDNLNDALHKSGIFTYNDVNRTQKRKRMPIRSIEDSKFHIIVLSKNYISSSWCLDELVKILECHGTIEQTVFPVFYDVEPNDVGYPVGKVGKAFAKLQNKEAAGRWRDALRKVAGLDGWQWKTNLDGHEEAKFIHKIVEGICLQLNFIRGSVGKKSFRYDLFLSFMVEDLIFVNNLHDALYKSGINTYSDVNRIEKGKRISDELIRSIQDSKFHIIVLSKSYTSSSWCLDELIKIMECHEMIEHTAFPVFYDVEPTEVRYQGGAVGKAFAKLQYEEAAGRWRDALRKAAALDGWQWKTSLDGHEEAKFIHKIVEGIFLQPHFINRSVDKCCNSEIPCGEYFVGMETRVKNFVSYLETGSDDVRVIGISGIAGGGKTTLAKAVFDHISIWFEAKSFVQNVGRVSRCSLSGLTILQKQVMVDVFNDKNIIQRNVYEGLHKMKTMMGSRKALVVLDGVDHIEQLEVLAGGLTWFGPGSRIIFTTRDVEVLAQHSVYSAYIYDINLLSSQEAVTLFSWYSFRTKIHAQGYEELSGKVVNYAAGLPLTIKVLGSYLCNRTKHEWLYAIERLKKIPLLETLDKLEASYRGLEPDQQDIFLDVVCILEGEKVTEAIKILEGMRLHAVIVFRVLELNSLITIHNVDRIQVHDLIMDLGYKIVRRVRCYDPSRHSRLWIREEIEDILVKELDAEARSIKLEGSDFDLAIVMKGLRKMKILRLLYVESEYIKWKVDDVSPYLPNSLESLHWPGYPLGCLPNTFQADNLGYLAMVESSICQLWEGGERKVLKRLKFLNLSGSKLISLDLEMTPNLEELLLGECVDLEDLRVSVECSRLKTVVLGCCKLTSLNLGMVPNLKELYLENCNEFAEFHMPAKLGKLSLWMEDIKHVPDSVLMLKHLKYLELDSCIHLEQLPEDLNRLECLEELYLTNCISLRYIPSSICKMKCLKRLCLPYCILVKELPKELGRLDRLKELNLEGAGLRHLPQSIVQLKGLHITGSRGMLESYGFTFLVGISSYTASCYI